MSVQKLIAYNNRHFFAHLGARKLMVCEFLNYHCRPEFDGILQYFLPPSGNNLEL